MNIDLPKLLKKLSNEIIYKLMYYYKLQIKKDEFLLTVEKWFKDRGDLTLRLNYPLNENSIVLDVGGYRGEWTLEISKRYNCYIYVFEPVPDYFNIISKKFHNNKKVTVFNFWLSDKDETVNIFIDDDKSSIYHKSGKKCIKINTRDILTWLNEVGWEIIDLIKINIEGGEYALLKRMIKRMIDMNITKKFKNIQIQFHKFYPNAENLREIIRTSLQETHNLTYDYPFVWENWRIKGT